MRLSKKGFTLIELVITMLIVVIVFGILANLVGFSTTFFRDENSQVANQTGLRQVAVTFEKDIRKHALNQSQIAVSGSCYTLGGTITYCHDLANQTITRNSVTVAKGIQTFTVNYDALKANLYIKTILDSRSQFVDISYDVYFRTDR